MPFCHQCGVDNPDWARFCDQCGAELIHAEADAPPPAASQPDAGSAPAPVVTSQCPQCGTEVLPGEAFCDNCGAPLTRMSAAGTATNNAPAGIPPQQNYPAPQPFGIPPAAAPAPAPQSPAPPPPAAPAPPPTAPPASQNSLTQMRLYLTVRNTALSIPDATQAIIGRADPVSGVYPDIDLASYGALEQGVGRRHLRISMQHGQIMAEDLDSTNGSYLNGQRLLAHTAQPLKNGDELRLGRLALRVEL